MNIFKIDYKRLIRLLLPTMLRQPIITAFLDALITPVRSVYNLFLINRNSSRYRLGITPQVCYLEKLINDRFDSDARRIYIGDGVHRDTLYAFTDGESKDIYIFAASENQDEYLYTKSEAGSESADFIVNVPGSLQFDEPELIALLNVYKLASKTFKINKI